MTSDTVVYTGGRIFDGERLHQDQAARVEAGVFMELVPKASLDAGEHVVDLNGGILSPGYSDLQVNGGGGVMFNDDPSLQTLTRITRAHRSLGATAILPTLITDTPEKTLSAIEAVKAALHADLPGIAGLHLEGPHLSVARKGAHDAALIRPMEEADLDLLLSAKAAIPVLKVTIAPENVSLDQVARMADAGILVSLGHSDAGYETCCAYAEAGACCVTHLFNAMSQLGNREPGLVGAALTSGTLSAGLIADAIHVHPSTMRAAWNSKTGPGRIFLVSDAMAVAGTDHDEFFLEGRRICRKQGRLTLEDGTLAGADLDLTTAVRVLATDAGIDLEDALRAATTTPSQLIGLPAMLEPGQTELSSLILINQDLSGVTPLDSAVSRLQSQT